MAHTQATKPAAHGGRPSIMGEAPALALKLLPLLALAAALTAAFPSAFRWTGRYWGVAVAVGIELAAVGLVYWLSAAVSLVRAWRGRELATRFSYALCRHPIFAWWIWSVLPSLALIWNSWLFLPVAAAFALLARPAACREDDELADRFGTAFCEYEARVRLLLPLPYLLPIRVRRYARAAGVLALLGVFVLLAYFAAVRPFTLRLGVSRAEAVAAMEGDELLGRARSAYTQATTIDAPAEEVWKWLVQVGYKRAGWYNVDAINRLAGPDYFIDGRGSSNRIHPELQNLVVGDQIHLVPMLGMTVSTMEPARLLVLAGDPANPEAQSNAVWAYRLDPLGPERCRLVVRFRSTFPGGLLMVVVNGLVNEIGGAIIQQPAMLHGIRVRAERAFRAPPR